MRRRVAPVLFTACLLLGACAGGDDETTSATGATTTTVAAADPAASDEDLAEAAVLVVSDLPAGFAESPDDEGPDGDDEDDPFDKCLGSAGDELEAATTAEADSPQFEKGDTTLAGSSAVVFKTEADARGTIQLLASAKGRTCFNEAIAQGFEEGFEEEGAAAPDLETSVGALSFPRVGDEVVSYRARIDFTVEGQELSFPFDLVFVRKGRTIGFYFFGNLGAPFPVKDEQAAVTKALARLG